MTSGPTAVVRTVNAWLEPFEYPEVLRKQDPETLMSLRTKYVGTRWIDIDEENKDGMQEWVEGVDIVWREQRRGFSRGYFVLGESRKIKEQKITIVEEEWPVHLIIECMECTEDTEYTASDRKKYKVIRKK